MKRIEGQPRSSEVLMNSRGLDAAALPVGASSGTAIASAAIAPAKTTCRPSACSTPAAVTQSTGSGTTTVEMTAGDNVFSNHGLSESCVADKWDECADVIAAAVPEMRTGEMIHPPNFSLFAAMSAIELMEPKMDVGCRPSRKLYETALPAILSDEELMHVCDELLARMTTWMNAHTLPQTIFSCAYVQRFTDIPRVELAVYVKVMLATVSIFRHVVSAEQVADEEDFISFDFGLTLSHLSESNVSASVRSVLADKEEPERTAKLDASNNENPTEKLANVIRGRRNPIEARLLFLQTLHALCSSMYASRSLRFRHVRSLIQKAEEQLHEIRASQPCGEDHVVNLVFDQTYNQHLLANTPPRTAPVLTRVEAFESLFGLLGELKALTDVKRSLLPYTPGLLPGNPRKYSFQVLIHGLISFSAQCHPTVLSRSLLKRMLIPEMLSDSLVLSVTDASMSSLLVGDISFTGPVHDETVLKEQVIELTLCAAHIVWSLCRNQGRQRRYIIKSLTEWDRGFRLLFGQSDSPQLRKPSLVANSSDRQITLAEKSQRSIARSLPVLGLEVTVRLMVQHWLLGFECNLYHPSEFAAVYFYVGYLLGKSSMMHIAESRGVAEVEDAGTQAPRLALYMFDEARWRLCKATFSVLEAIQIGKQWNYNWRRYPQYPEGTVREQMSNTNVAREVSEELWYEQRFGMMREYRLGPRFLSYDTFSRLRFEFLNRGALSENENVSRLLNDAVDSFKAARIPLGRAAQLATSCSWDILADEAKKLGRVATMNCIAVSRLLVLSHPKECKLESGTAVPHIQLKFDEHRHFPGLLFVGDKREDAKFPV